MEGINGISDTEQQLVDQKNFSIDLGTVMWVELNHFLKQIKKQAYRQ